MKSSTPFFKVLNAKGMPIDGSGEYWPLPAGGRPGRVMDFSFTAARCRYTDTWSTLPGIRGTWLVNDPRGLYPPGTDRTIWVAEVIHPEDLTLTLEGVVWTTRVRLLRRATARDLSSFGIYHALKQIL